MDRLFETRKRELVQECVVEDGLFARSLMRLDEFMKPFIAQLLRLKQRHYATTVVRGLCSDLERKNAESIAYHFGMDRKQIQHFIGISEWDDQHFRKELARQIATQRGEQDGVLYLPEEWTKNKTRMKKAGIPNHKQKYRTRHQMCLELLNEHGQSLPHQWITGDDELGRPIEFRRELQRLGEQYLLAVPCNTKFVDLETEQPDEPETDRKKSQRAVRVDQWAAAQPDAAWQRIDVRDGEKGPLVVELLKRRVETGHRSAAKVSVETLVVIRYRDRDEGIAKQDYYMSNADIKTSPEEFGRVSKAAHRVEECFDRGKGEAGMADYEVRNWVGWQHHQTLTLLASWFLNVETRRAEKKDVGNDIESGTSEHGFDHSGDLRMRFTPRRQPSHHPAIGEKPTRQTLSLATT
ncbi:MAG: transposase [Planctomycetales bacterium]|nr:transposase [Planctomycetales bacterium]